MAVELTPQERAALTVAWSQVQRGEFPMPACATVCVVALARLFYEKQPTEETKTEPCDTCGSADCEGCLRGLVVNTKDERPRCEHGYLKGKGFEAFTICPHCPTSNR